MREMYKPSNLVKVVIGEKMLQSIWTQGETMLPTKEMAMGTTLYHFFPGQDKKIKEKL